MADSIRAAATFILLLSCLEGLMEEMERYTGHNKTWHYRFVCVCLCTSLYSHIKELCVCANNKKQKGVTFPHHLHCYSTHILSHISCSKIELVFSFSRSIISLAIKLQRTLLKDINSGHLTWWWCLSLRWDMSCLVSHYLERRLTDIETISDSLHQSFLTIRNIKSTSLQNMCFTNCYVLSWFLFSSMSQALEMRFSSVYSILIKFDANLLVGDMTSGLKLLQCPFKLNALNTHMGFHLLTYSTMILLYSIVLKSI